MFSASELPEVLNRQSWIRSVFVSQRSWTLWRSGWKRSSAKCPTSKYEREGLSVTLKVCCHYADLVSTFHTLLHLFLFSLQLLSFLFYFSSWYAWKRSLQMSWVCVSLQCSASLCSINRCGTPPPPHFFSKGISMHFMLTWKPCNLQFFKPFISITGLHFPVLS